MGQDSIFALTDNSVKLVHRCCIDLSLFLGGGVYRPPGLSRVTGTVTRLLRVTVQKMKVFHTPTRQ